MKHCKEKQSCKSCIPQNSCAPCGSHRELKLYVGALSTAANTCLPHLLAATHGPVRGTTMTASLHDTAGSLRRPWAGLLIYMLNSTENNAVCAVVATTRRPWDRSRFTAKAKAHPPSGKGMWQPCTAGSKCGARHKVLHRADYSQSRGFLHASSRSASGLPAMSVTQLLQRELHKFTFALQQTCS